MNDFAAEIRYIPPGSQEGMNEGYFTARFLLPSDGFMKSFEYYVAFKVADSGPEMSLADLEELSLDALKHELQNVIERIDAEREPVVKQGDVSAGH